MNNPQKPIEPFWFDSNPVKSTKPNLLVKLFKITVVLLLVLTAFTCNTPAPITVKTIDIETYNCVKEALYYEARGEPEQGMKAVLSVTHNRTKNKNYPNTYCKVIQQPMQFSYRNSISSAKQLKTAYTRSELLASRVASDLAYRAATGAFKPSMHPSVLYYCSYKINPSWSKQLKTYATIGHHKFFTT